MSVLAIVEQTLPATPAPMLEYLAEVQERMLRLTQADLPTEHVLHGGMYARTVRLAQDTVITGALIKLATVLVVNGHAMVLVGEGWIEMAGFNVIPASAGRKQVFVALGPVEITMIFPTQAKTVAEAEEEFTDEADMLLSRRA